MEERHRSRAFSPAARSEIQGKGKGKGANKGAGKQSVQLSQVVYFGDEEGYIVCTRASGDNV